MKNSISVTQYETIIIQRTCSYHINGIGKLIPYHKQRFFLFLVAITLFTITVYSTNGVVAVVFFIKINPSNIEKGYTS